MYQEEGNQENIQAYEVEVLHGKNNRNSFGWKYFGKLILIKDGKRRHIFCERVFCKVCLKSCQEKQDDQDDPESAKLTKWFLQIKSYSKTIATGNLVGHLRSAHDLNDETATAESSKALSTKLTSYFQPNRKASVSGKDAGQMKRKLLARDAALWLCRSLLPFDLMDDEGTNDFMRKYNVVGPGENLPSRSTVSKGGLDDVYKAMWQFVKDRVQNTSDFGCITLDGWTDRYRRNSYFTFTYHHITDDFELENCVLQTSVCFEKKTGSQICLEITGVLERYGISEKEVIYVTDAGANMKAALTLLEATHHLCLGHGIHNLVSKDGIRNTPSLESICSKSKSLCKTVKYRAPDLEREAQKSNDSWLQSSAEQGWLENILDVEGIIDDDDVHPIDDDPGNGKEVPGQELATTPFYAKIPKSVKISIPTRWHSILLMLESMEINKVSINSVLVAMGKTDMQLNNVEINLIKSLIRFLKTFRTSVEILSAEKSCTINLALLLRSELQSRLQDEESDISSIGDLKRRMLEKLDYRFPITDLLIVAALLDPRCHNLEIVNKYIDGKGVNKIQFLTNRVRQNIQHKYIKGYDMPESQEASTSQELKASKAQDLLNLSKKFSVGDTLKSKAIDKEVSSYLSSTEPEDVVDGEILLFWKNHRNQYPWLSTAAKKFLCVQATSTPSERVFSIAGLTLNINGKTQQASPRQSG